MNPSVSRGFAVEAAYPQEPRSGFPDYTQKWVPLPWRMQRWAKLSVTS